MERRTFLKRIFGYSCAITAGGLALPHHAKCEIVKPFANIISQNYLDNIIQKNVFELKRQHPNLSLGEMHCHSYFSDGNYSVNDLVLRSALLGLDFIVITEHLTPKEYKLEGCLKSIATQYNILNQWDHQEIKPPTLYPAFEISTREGHLIAVFPEDYFKPTLLQEIKRYFEPFYYYEVPVETVAKLIHKMNGIAIVPHPNIPRSYPFGIPTDFIQKNLAEHVDAIEDISTAHGYQKNYSKEAGLASVGSSDDHFNILIGTTVTVFDRTEQKNLFEAIRNHKTQAFQITNSLDLLFAPTKLFFRI